MKNRLNFSRLIFIVYCFAFTTVLCIYKCDSIKAQEVEATIEMNGKPLKIKINQSTDTILQLMESSAK